MVRVDDRGEASRVRGGHRTSRARLLRAAILLGGLALLRSSLRDTASSPCEKIGSRSTATSLARCRPARLTGGSARIVLPAALEGRCSRPRRASMTIAATGRSRSQIPHAPNRKARRSPERSHIAATAAGASGSTTAPTTSRVGDFCVRNDMLVEMGNDVRQRWDFGSFAIENDTSLTCDPPAVILDTRMTDGQKWRPTVRHEHADIRDDDLNRDPPSRREPEGRGRRGRDRRVPLPRRRNRVGCPVGNRAVRLLARCRRLAAKGLAAHRGRERLAAREHHLHATERILAEEHSHLASEAACQRIASYLGDSLGRASPLGRLRVGQ